MSTPDFAALLATVEVTPYIGRTIVQFREKRGMTQSELAKASGVDLSAVKRLESGRKSGGWLVTVERLCQALEVTLEAFFKAARLMAVQAALTTLWGQVP